jgi:hypothetical protein
MHGQSGVGWVVPWQAQQEQWGPRELQAQDGAWLERWNGDCEEMAFGTGEERPNEVAYEQCRWDGVASAVFVAGFAKAAQATACDPLRQRRASMLIAGGAAFGGAAELVAGTLEGRGWRHW